jgi:DNA repair exonuclease SbcCD ATPase subunit
MKLTGVSVEGCGKFGTLTRIEGLGPGVNILSARNEAGKSTLFRAVRTCLFERHNTTKDEVKRLATDGLSLPIKVTLDFEHEGKRYQLVKSFLRSPSAQLFCDGIEMARARAADESVWDLLGIKPDNKIDQAAYGVLWVEQGQSFEVPKPSEGAAGVLNDVIQQEVGTLVGGERARLLLAGLREELATYLTEGGRSKANGPLDLAAKNSARITTERLEVETKLAELNHRMESLSELRAELKRASAGGGLQQMTRELAEARQRREATEKAVQSLARLQAEERHAHGLLSAQREKLAALRSCASAIDENRARLKQMASALAPLDEEETSARHALAEATAKTSALDLEAEELDTRERGIKRLQDLGQRQAQRATMAQRLALLQDYRSRAAQNEAALGSATMGEDALKTLDEIEQEKARLTARIEAAAARITITAKSGSGVVLNGADVAGTMARAVTEPLNITVGSDVVITVSPPAASVSAAEEKLREQHGKMSALLAQHGARDAQELRQMRSARMVLEEKARELKAERTALTLKGTATAEIERLEVAIAEIDAKTRQALEASGASALPPSEELDIGLEAISSRRSEVKAQRIACEAMLQGQNEVLARVLQQRGNIDGQMREIHTKLQLDLLSLPDTDRQSLLDEGSAEAGRREAAHRTKALLYEESRAQAPDEAETQRLAARVERLSSAIDNHKALIEQLNQKIARLEGEIQTAGGDGLGERASALRLEEVMAKAEFDRHTERVEVLSLLRSTVEKCYERRREELNAPLRRHLKPFLHDVFPQAEIELGESFAVAGLNRFGPGSELFGRLSLGTQEQVAVLVRLAMGAMICERGPDIPIILDDALVFSDDERIEQMFDAINRAGRNQQVIVLTCRARSFASLGGKQLQIV